jgi:hypothetical protein
MRPAVAISELQVLRDEALRSPEWLRSGGRDAAWRAKVEGVLTRSLGAQHHTTEGFREVRYGLSFWSDTTPDSAWTQAFVRGVQDACGYVDAAIYELQLLTDDDGPVDDRAFDPELWDHVKGILVNEDWGKVASLVATFVEDRVRIWAGRPRDKSGEDLYGKGLYAAVFADNAEFRLGKRKGEWEGWRMIGMGFAQAIGNVDRHHVQDRSDARRYALGVLGLGSLLLTQLRFEHGDHLKGGDEGESGRREVG